MPRLGWLVSALLLTIPVPAAADWLVTRSGEEIETDGAWEARGALIVFTSAGGRLSSLRAREVDLDASRERTAAPAAPEPEPPAETPPPRPVLVITDADVAHVPSGAGTDLDPAAGDDEGAASPESEPSAGSIVEVVSWQDRVDVQANTLEVSGTAVNRGSSLATGTRLEVRLLDRSGGLVESRRASLGAGFLAPGAVVSFSATFPGSPGFASIEFDVQSRGFRVRPEPEAVPDP